MKRLAAILIALLSTLPCFSQLQRIPIKSGDAIIEQYNSEDVGKLLDDNINTKYQAWVHTFPFRITFDLSEYQPCILKQLRYYVNNGNVLQIRYSYVRKRDGKEINFFTYTGGDWIQHEVSVDIPNSDTASFFIIDAYGIGDFPEYLQLWGSYQNTPITSAPVVHYPIKNFLQVVCHPYDFDKILDPVKEQAVLNSGITGIRMYDHVSINKSEDGKFSFNPTVKIGVHPDPFFKDLADKVPGAQIQICWADQSLAIQKQYPFNSVVDVPYGEDRDSAVAWTEYGQDAFVLASRYATNKNVPDYPLWVDPFYCNANPNWCKPNDSMLKGSNLVKVFEGWNEDDGFWWIDPLTPHQIMMSNSVWYDGHEGRITNAGIKTIDKSALVSSGGMASDLPDLLHYAKYWAIKNRSDGKIPFDVYSFHCYPWGGLPIELSVAPKTKAIVDAANKYCDGVKTILGEVGYDINTASPAHAPAFSNYTSEQVRGIWMIRGLYEFSKIGLYASQWYRLLQDYGDNNGNTFGTMSFFKIYDKNVPVDSLVRRTVADYFKQQKTFWEYSYQKSVVDNDSVRVYKFSNNTALDLYPMWTIEDTSHGQIRERFYKYALSVTGTLYELNDDSSGVLKSKPYNGETITLSSNPVFVVGSPLVILPIKENPKPIHKPKPNEHFHYELIDAIGQILSTGETNDILSKKNQVKYQMPIQQVLFLHYWNDKNSYTEKIIKQ